jgi:shikimate kinase
MQSSGQLTEELFKKNREQGYRALETRVVARMKFFAGGD